MEFKEYARKNKNYLIFYIVFLIITLILGGVFTFLAIQILNMPNNEPTHDSNILGFSLGLIVASIFYIFATLNLVYLIIYFCTPKVGIYVGNDEDFTLKLCGINGKLETKILEIEDVSYTFGFYALFLKTSGNIKIKTKNGEKIKIRSIFNASIIAKALLTLRSNIN